MIHINYGTKLFPGVLTALIEEDAVIVDIRGEKQEAGQRQAVLKTHQQSSLTQTASGQREA